MLTKVVMSAVGLLGSTGVTSTPLSSTKTSWKVNLFGDAGDPGDTSPVGSTTRRTSFWSIPWIEKS